MQREGLIISSLVSFFMVSKLLINKLPQVNLSCQKTFFRQKEQICTCTIYTCTSTVVHFYSDTDERMTAIIGLFFTLH